MSEIHVRETIDWSHAGKRLDQVLVELFSEYSRNRLQAWCKTGECLLDGKQVKPGTKLKGGELLTLDTVLIEDGEVEAQPIPLKIVHEDDAILVINKPAGLVVHPAAGNRDGTLLNGLLYYDKSLYALPRGGIVHRLDKETSGLLVVAKTLTAHKSLVDQLQARTVHRQYFCIAQRQLVSGGSIDQPIGRHPVDRTRMAVVESGKEAITHYLLEERFQHFTALQVQLETGRTHQIRVHLAWIDHALLGDPLYGGRLKLPKGASDALQTALRQFRRQALHARALSFIHPELDEPVMFEAALPDDLQQLIAVIRAEDGLHTA